MLKKCVLVGVIAGSFSVQAIFGQSSATADFKRDVMPILKAHCVDCHGPSLQMNGFRLDRRSDAMKGGTAAMIGPGNSAASRMYLKLLNPQYGPQMPPAGALPKQQIEIIRKWIDEGANWPDAVAGEIKLPPPDEKASRLMKSLRRGDSAEVRKLVAAEPGSVKGKGPGGSTPLMYAVLYGDLATVKMLIGKGADVNARNHNGATALLWAADNLEKTRLLLDHHADVNAKSESSRTALIIAAGVYGQSAVVKLLLERGADVSAKGPALFRAATALSEAALAGDEASMRLLIEHGADPKSAGPAGLAFTMRAQCGPCTALLTKSPDPGILSEAMFFVSPPLGPGFGVQPLLAWGADAKAKDPGGNSILALVASSPASPVDAIKALLDAGADKNGTLVTGETPLELAKRHGRTPVVELLEKAGATESHIAETYRIRPKPAADLRTAVQRSLPLLQRNDASFLKKSGCVSCHNNSLEAEAIALARKKGFPVNEAEAQQQLKTVGTYLETWREKALQNIGIPGDTDTVGSILVGLGAANYPADAATDAMARYIRLQQRPDGHWISLATRPPLESSDLEVTAVAMRALQLYAPKTSRAEYDAAVKMAAAWMSKATPGGTAEGAYHLRALVWSGADKELIRKAAAGLIAEQRSDGGWAQIPTTASDAYATGEALVALQESGAAADAACKRGLEWLRMNQAEDGSWYVKRRAVPIQPHFDAGFPYGKDQFISAAATNWATIAMAMASK